jgi:hypothetical protein
MAANNLQRRPMSAVLRTVARLLSVWMVPVAPLAGAHLGVPASVAGGSLLRNRGTHGKPESVVADPSFEVDSPIIRLG